MTRACTICTSPDAHITEPVPANPVVVALIHAITGQHSTASRAWCLACWTARFSVVASGEGEGINV